MTAPEKLLVPYEDYESGRFTHVGRYGPGNQFMAFITGAFPRDWWSGRHPPEYLRSHWAEHKRWYAVLHRFDSDGNHSDTEVRPGGTTAGGEREAIERAHRELEALLSSLGEIHYCDIWVRPFEVEVDGYFFGLVYTCEDADDPDDPDGVIEYVMLEPNDIMFHPPWDSGEYST
jgi:formate hydrogenlyase regulatory protein HycA